MSFISIENLTTRYNTSKGLVHALEDVTFAIDKGESIGIAGESACGKKHSWLIYNPDDFKWKNLFWKNSI